MEIIALFPIPTSWSKKRQREAQRNFYLGRKDCDNIAKTVMDALNGEAYRDDAQVARLCVTKLYAKRPSEVGLQIIIYEEKEVEMFNDEAT